MSATVCRARRPTNQKSAQTYVDGAGRIGQTGSGSPVIRDAIIQAAVEAGGGDMVAYLKKQAETHPSAFMTLLGKVLPMQLTGGKGEPVNLEFSVRFVAAEDTKDQSAVGD